MSTRDARIDEYIAKAQPFARPILSHIRAAVHAGCPACDETLKWSHPAFMYKGILCSMAAFKEHVTFGFWRAAMAADVSRGERAWGQFGRITSIADLPPKRELVRLVKEAAAVHDSGVKAPRARKSPKKPLKESPDLLAALKKNKKAKRRMRYS